MGFPLLFANPLKSKSYRYGDSWQNSNQRGNTEKKLRTNVQKIKSDIFCYCKDGKSDNYIGSNRENIFKGTSHFYKI